MSFAPLFVLLLAMISIQSGASLAKNLFGIMSPEGITALRLFFAALLLFAVWRPWRKRIEPRNWRLLFMYGASLGLMNLFFYLSLARIPLGLAVAFEFTGPLALAIYSSRKPLDILWVTSALAGVLCLLPLSETSAALDWIGVLFALIAGACWAAYILCGQRASQRLPAGVATALGMMCGALVVMPVGLYKEGLELFSPERLPLALGVAVLSSAIPYSLEMYVMSRIPTKTFTILMSLEPALAALSGFLFLSERLTPLQALAIGLVIFASLGSSITAPKKSPAPIEV